MKTALLKPLADDRWQFGHQAFQEFLAAEYLLRRKVLVPTLASLLLAGSGPVRHVHPRHREAAGWVAWDCTDLLDDVLACDPEVLLGPGLTAQPAEVRARVVQSLVEDGVRNAGLSPWRFGGSLHRVDHDGLEQQLRLLLKAPTSGDDTAGYIRLSVGLAIAWACPQRVPMDALLDVAEDTALEATVRSEAVRAMPAALDAAAVERLERLAAGSAQRVPGELAQTAQMALWPGAVDTTRVLRLLTPSYLDQSWMEMTAQLGDGDTDPVLAWLLEQFSGECTSPAAAFGLLSWVMQRMRPAQASDTTAPPVQLAEVFAALVSDADTAYAPILHEVRNLLAAAPSWRRELAGMVLGLLPVGGHAVYFAVRGTSGLFPAEDSAFWAEAAASEPEGKTSALGVPLILPCPTDGQDLERLEQQRAVDPVLRDLTTRWFGPDPATIQAKLAAEREERHAERRNAIRASLNRLAIKRPTDPEDVRTWWRDISHLLQQGESNPTAPSSDLVDLRTAPSYTAAGSGLRESLAQCAAYALQHAPVVTAATAGAVAVSLSGTAPEATALTLATLPELAPERWAGLAWALAASHCPDKLQPLRRELLAHAAGAALDAWPAVLPGALDGLNPLTLQTAAPALWGVDSRTDALLLDWLADPARPFGVWLAAMRGLTAHGAPAQITDLLRARSTAPADQDIAGLNTWAQVIDLHLMCGPADDLLQVWEAITSTEARTQAWAQAAESWLGPGQGVLVHAPVAYWSPAYQTLTPAQAGLLYDRLTHAGMIDFPDPARPRDIAQGRRLLHSKLPDLIASTLTADAATELRRLAAAHPDRPHLHTLQQNHARLLSEITPDLPWEELRTLAAARDRRIVNNTGDLLSVVLEALESLSRQLRDANGWTTLLWQQSASKPVRGRPVERWPLWEDGFSDFLRNFLNNSLSDRKVVINREVQVRPAPDAHRGDILIHALSGNATTLEPLTVVIEVKPCWNDEIQDGLPRQLAAGYLTDHPTWAGIFLCGFFDDPQWTTTKRTSRHKAPRDHTLQGIRTLLEEQARVATQEGHTVTALVLDCTLPQPSVHGSHRQQGTAPNSG